MNFRTLISVSVFFGRYFMSDTLLTIQQTADLLNVSDITVKRYIREKLLQVAQGDGDSALLEKGAVERYKTITERLSKR